MAELTYLGHVAVLYQNDSDNQRYGAVFLSVGDEIHNLSGNGDKVNFTSLKGLQNDPNVTIQYSGPSVSAAEASLKHPISETGKIVSLLGHRMEEAARQGRENAVSPAGGLEKEVA